MHVKPGVHNICYGPFQFDSKARAIKGWQPAVDMRIVHHMIIYGAKRGDVAAEAVLRKHPNGKLNPRGCWGNHPIIYSWARVGQRDTGAIGMLLPDGHGFAVNGDEGLQLDYFYITLHYQNVDDPAHNYKARTVEDKSGVYALTLPSTPMHPVKIDILMAVDIDIPPKRKSYPVCSICKVHEDMTVLAYRNHAHRLARLIWSEVIRNGQRVGIVGVRSAQDPQLFYLADGGQPITLIKGDTLRLHCDYNSTDAKTHTTIGADERTHEMCNQYFLRTFHQENKDKEIVCSSGSHMECVGAQPKIGDTVVPERTWPWARRNILGQVTGVGVLRDNSVVAFHRADATYFNSQVISKATIVRMTNFGERICVAGENTFVTPHGLSVDHSDTIWVTDVGQHTVSRFRPRDRCPGDDGGDQETNLGSTSVTPWGFSCPRTACPSLVLGEAGVPGSDGRHFNKPTDVAVHSDGTIFVSDGYGNSRVAVFSSSGKFLREFGSFGSGRGEFNIPHSVTIDEGRRRVIVADRENGRAQVFDLGGRLISVWPLLAHLRQQTGRRIGKGGRFNKRPWLSYVSAVRYSPRLDHVVAIVADEVVLVTPTGMLAGKYSQGPNAGVDIGQFEFPHGIAIGNEIGVSMNSPLAVYASEITNNRIQKFWVLSDFSE